MTHQSTSRKNKRDEERTAITAAMERLLADPSSSRTGKLSVLQLAEAAGVKRWVLTLKHVDLKETFEARVAQLTQAQGPKRPLQNTSQHGDAAERDSQALARLRRENAELRARVDFLAQTVNMVTIKYEALKAAREAEAGIVRLSREHRPSAVDDAPTK